MRREGRVWGRLGLFLPFVRVWRGGIVPTTTAPNVTTLDSVLPGTETGRDTTARISGLPGDEARLLFYPAMIQ